MTIIEIVLLFFNVILGSSLIFITSKFDAQAFEAKWNALSWEVQEAISSLSGILGWMEWDKEREIIIESVNPVYYTHLQKAGITISHALVTWFFISICRIRESNSKFSLHVLNNLCSNHLPPSQFARVKMLMESTNQTLEKIKCARDKRIAHLDIDTNPFVILKQQGVSRDDVLTYLNQCEELFYIFGTLIGKENKYKVRDFDDDLLNQMKYLHSLIEPAS